MNRQNLENMLSRIGFILCMVLLVGGLKAQEDPPSTDEAIEQEYQKRIKKEYLNRVYIPKDLADCFIQLNQLIDDESKQKFKRAPEDVVARKLHFSLGRWMIHNWSFYQGSRLSAYLKGLGIHYPDDMARFIIISYHRNLNRQELNVKEQIEYYQQLREKEHQEAKTRGEVIYEEKRKVDPPKQ